MRLLAALRDVASLAGIATLSPAQVVSGPEVGAALTKVDVFAPSGPRAGTTFDAAAVLGQAPGAILFVSELTRNVAPMVRGLDLLAAEHALLGFRACTVLLAGDRTAAENQLERASPALGLVYPMVVSVDGSDGPGSYGLNRKCTLTLVLANAGKVVRSVGFTDTGAQDVQQLEKWIVELTGPLPHDVAGTRALLARRHPGADGELLDLTAALLVQARRQQRADARMGGAGNRRDTAERAADTNPTGAAPQARARAGKAPDDAELRTLLRAVIQKTATAADLDATFREVATRVGSDADLQAQAVAMFELVLSLGYGTDDARQRCEAYVAAHRGGVRGK